MNMCKKITALFLLATVGLTALTGCGNGDTSQAQNTTTPDGGEKINLRFMSWLSDQEEQDKAVAAAYEALHPNVSVTFEYVGAMVATDYYKTVDLMLMGGEVMDIVMTSAYPEHAERASTGSYLPLDDYFKAEGVKPEEAYTIYSPVNGQLYGIPADVKSWMVLINKAMLDEAGLEVPSLDWTWDDYREYANALTKGDGVNKRYGSYFHSWDHYDYLGLWSTKKDNPIMKSETEMNFDDPNFADWMQFRYDMENVDKCSVPLSDVLSLNMNYRDQFFTGKVAMLPIGSWMLAELEDQGKYPHDFVTTFAPLPRFKDGQEGSTFTQSQYYSIAKTSKHPQEAYDFIRFYTTEGMNIKGVSITAEANTDKMESINKMIGEAKYCDTEALEKVINNPKWFDNIHNISPIFQKTLATMVKEECDLYLLGDVSLDQLIDTLNKKGQQIIDEHK